MKVASPREIPPGWARAKEAAAPDVLQVAAWLWRLAIAFIALQWLAVWFWPPPMSDPDESLYALITREMLDSGDFITVKYPGQPYPDRPALHFWLTAGAVTLLGETDFVLRLPSLLLGLGTVAAVAGIAKELYTANICIGAAAGLTMATMAGPIAASLAVGHDTSLSCFATAAIWAALAARRRSPAASWSLAAGAGLLAGLAVLSKGLLGLVIPIVALGSFLLVDWRRGQRSANYSRIEAVAKVVLATMIALIAGSSWYVLMEQRNPGYLHYFFIERHIEGFLTNTQRHGEVGLWVYGVTLLVGGAPWIFFLFMPAWHALWRISRAILLQKTSFPMSDGLSLGIQEREKYDSILGWTRADRHASTLAVVLWFVGLLTLFCAAGSKNPSYLLPVFAPLAILAGRHLTLWLSDAHGRWAVRRRMRQLSVCVFAAATTLVLSAWLVVPKVIAERTSLPVLHRLRLLAAPGTRVLWFNSVPRSALYYGGDLRIRQATIAYAEERVAAPTILVAKRTWLPDLERTRLAHDAYELAVVGLFHILELHGDPQRSASATTVAP